MISIELEKQPPNYQPGDLIRGKVVWNSLHPKTDHLDVELLWGTVGRGTPDLEVVSTIAIDKLSEQGSRAFEFTAPHRPYSFSGSLISLEWEVRVRELPGVSSVSSKLTNGPKGIAVTLPPVESSLELNFLRVRKKQAG